MCLRFVDISSRPSLIEVLRGVIDDDTLWVRGGYPLGLTAGSDADSAQWRADLVRAYLESDVPMFAPRIPAETLRRLWTMLAHHGGRILNASALASGLGVTSPTVGRYIDLLADLGLVRRVPAWHTNTSKRVVKAPKVFVRDTGLLHSLLELGDLDQVLGHPAAGPSYETFAVEVKRSTSPTLSAGTRRAVRDLGVDAAYLVHPDSGAAYDSGGVTVIGLGDLVRRLRPS